MVTRYWAINGVHSEHTAEAESVPAAGFCNVSHFPTAKASVKGDVRHTPLAPERHSKMSLHVFGLPKPTRSHTIGSQEAPPLKTLCQSPLHYCAAHSTHSCKHSVPQHSTAHSMLCAATAAHPAAQLTAHALRCVCVAPLSTAQHSTLHAPAGAACCPTTAPLLPLSPDQHMTMPPSTLRTCPVT